MEFTGTNLVLKRNIYPQTGNYGFNIDLTVADGTGAYFFGLSGNGNKIEFSLNSGKIIFDNKFIHSYQANQQFSISADFTNSRANIRKDNIALVYGATKPTGFFEYFYLKRENSTMGAFFDVNVSGDSIPSYVISDNNYLLYSGQTAVTGYFSNNSTFPIKIFDSNIQSNENYTFAKLPNSVAGRATGFFAYSGDYDLINISEPIFTTFDTNFGDATVLFTITDLRAQNGFVLLQDIPVFPDFSSNVMDVDIAYTNFSGGVGSSDFNAQLTFILDYISGSGVFGGYNKDFSGSWSMQTGVNFESLYSMPLAITQNGTRISGGGTFTPNSFMNLQVTHILSGTNSDSATLTISGDLVYNPISTILDEPNT